MNVLVCPDKFKGSLTAKEVCRAVEQAIAQVRPSMRVQSIGLADGGEGTCALLTEWHGGRHVELPVHGPLFKRIRARYGISAPGDTAFIEMAEASGLTRLKPNEQNPLFTTTLGTGELIVDALDRGVTRIILGIGGSATNDAGIGMASALGYEFYDTSNNLLEPVGKNLVEIRTIRTGRLHKRLDDVRVTTLCDVTNPLCGPNGAAYIYGPQKGADESAIRILDAGLENFQRIVQQQLGISLDFPGAGAAGGLGAGARVFLNATIESGVTFFVDSVNLASYIRDADIVITGEGKIDHQTFSGKVVSEVIRLAAQEKKPVYAICGISELTDNETRARGLSGVMSLVDGDTSPQLAVKHADQLIKRRIQEMFMNDLEPLI